MPWNQAREEHFAHMRASNERIRANRISLFTKALFTLSLQKPRWWQRRALKVWRSKMDALNGLLAEEFAR